MPDESLIKKALARHGLAPSKERGQNFLIHDHVTRRIVEKSGVRPEDVVVELGVGLGSLTLPLAARVRRVIGLEIDRGIIEYHREAGDLPANVTLRHQDLLTADYPALAAECGGRLKIVANLPYSITNPLLFRLIEHRTALDSATLMVQKEVGQRLTAGTGTKEYGILTVLFGACARIEKVLEVGPGNFYPRPKVDSVVLRIVFTPPAAFADAPPFDFALFRQMVESAFRQRRKTLRNSLGAMEQHGCAREAVERALAAAGISPTLRAENLTAGDFARLAANLTGPAARCPES
ncbi:MAG: 16S rRNA (adenine(1518)-N(6)/adenine(1519)-N(6))-dimethyltransferase RsmA [Thermodesulfobacteriota bacterium]